MSPPNPPQPAFRFHPQKEVKTGVGEREKERKEKKISNNMRNIWYKGCFCHTQEFVMGTILSLCNCSLEIVLFLIKAT